jgi:hypothetical protein
MKLKTRLYVATEKEDNYKLWDSFTKEEKEDIKLGLQIQYLEKVGAKNIKIN